MSCDSSYVPLHYQRKEKRKRKDKSKKKNIKSRKIDKKKKNVSVQAHYNIQCMPIN